MHAPRPPSADPLVALADQCVQCGLCLPACPTYRHGRIEAESPRGRIALARAWALDAVDPTPVGDAHLDHCLACRSCEAVCPAGVRYGALLLEARSRQRARRGVRWRQAAIEWLAARPRLLAAVLGLYRMAHGLLPAGWRPLPRPPAPVALPVPMHGAPERVALFVGCVAQAYEPPVRLALARLLAAAGVALAIPEAQGCCGTLHAHAGSGAVATSLARRTRGAFGRDATVLTLASGCHEAVAGALAGEATTIDAIEFLAARHERLHFRPATGRVALHLPCTQRTVVGSVPALRRLLAAVPGLEVVELTAGYGCCGAAGTRMLTDPASADSYRAPLLEQLQASGAATLLSANVGCRLHLANGTGVPMVHPLEFLAGHLA